MQCGRRNDVRALRREIMWRRMRPAIPHTRFPITRALPREAFRSRKAMRGLIALRKRCVRSVVEARALL